MVEPDCVTLLVTIAVMYAGAGPSGGGGLLPVRVVNEHVVVSTVLAQPLNDGRVCT